MSARRKVALAMSLGLGIACQTTRGERTASVPAATGAEQEQREETAQQEQREETAQQEQREETAQQEQRGETAQQEQERAGELVFTGTVSDVYEDTIFVVNELGRTELIRVGPETDVTVSGRKAQLSEIREGQQVRAAYEDREGRNVATQITAGEPGTTQLREPGTIEEPAAPRFEEEGGTSGTPTSPAPER